MKQPAERRQSFLLQQSQVNEVHFNLYLASGKAEKRNPFDQMEIRIYSREDNLSRNGQNKSRI